MRCPKQTPAEEAQHAQFLQQLGGPGMLWPPCPPAPQPAFNPWIASQYPMTGSMPPLQSQLPPLVPGLGERWFQGLVAAVSKEIKDNEKKAAADNARKKNAAPADLSVEDEKALIAALRRQREGTLTMEQVFGELSKKYGHTETEWKTLFFANYERLLSKLDLHSNLGPASEGSPQRFTSPVASRTRSMSRNQPSRSSTRTASRTLTDSLEESESEFESETETESEWGELCSDGRSALRELESSSSSPRAKRKPPRGARQYCRVTDADLRAMAQYRFENGDGDEVRRYGYCAWREFALRPENSKRTLPAWRCIPRRLRHAAAIDRYVREFQLRVEVTGSKPILPILPDPQDSPGTSRSGPGMAVEAAQKEASMNQQNGNSGSENATMASRATDAMEIIDLTDDKVE
ncbi:hypothetical protein GSI_14312 [Ganoderma sinense ZZ0214-1]|uniref:Uncharacterized protein n=1 Tax=Ganoderma sinense ZZ0214-1 TaxID=1077348 RepID=A0A2G8RNB2_9APHY|nr:hypothetical protein GSI_14312 [Ganoderma sinense ZZ0214-1]